MSHTPGRKIHRARADHQIGAVVDDLWALHGESCDGDRAVHDGALVASR
jgi:hypothetical protein